MHGKYFVFPVPFICKWDYLFLSLSILKGKGEDKNETFFDIGQHPIITDDGICGLLLSGDGFDYRQADGKARDRTSAEKG